MPKHSKSSWELVVPGDGFATMEEAKKAAVTWSDAADGGRQGGKMWAVDRKCPGNGKTRAQWRCVLHVDCPVRQRMVDACDDGLFYREVKGVHASELVVKPRTNSKFTLEQAYMVKFGVDSGCKPAGIRAALTMVEKARLLVAGLVPEEHKRKDGGLLGSPLRSPSLINIPCFILIYILYLCK